MAVIFGKKKRGRLQRRPDVFELDYDHSLARGLVFAGLGEGFKSLKYRDSSGRNNHGR